MIPMSFLNMVLCYIQDGVELEMRYVIAQLPGRRALAGLTTWFTWELIPSSILQNMMLQSYVVFPAPPYVRIILR